MDTDADTCYFVGIGWTNAAPSRIDAVCTTRDILYPIQQFMIGHHYMCTIRDKEICTRNALFCQTVQLFQQCWRINDRPRTHNTGTVRVENTARDEVQLEFAIGINNGMSSITASLE